VRVVTERVRSYAVDNSVRPVWKATIL
jgi:hypothetical protein